MQRSTCSNEKINSELTMSRKRISSSGTKRFKLDDGVSDELTDGKSNTSNVLDTNTSCTYASDQGDTFCDGKEDNSASFLTPERTSERNQSHTEYVYSVKDSSDCRHNESSNDQGNVVLSPDVFQTVVNDPTDEEMLEVRKEKPEELCHMTNDNSEEDISYSSASVLYGSSPDRMPPVTEEKLEEDMSYSSATVLYERSPHRIPHVLKDGTKEDTSYTPASVLYKRTPGVISYITKEGTLEDLSFSPTSNLSERRHRGLSNITGNNNEEPAINESNDHNCHMVTERTSEKLELPCASEINVHQANDPTINEAASLIEAGKLEDARKMLTQVYNKYTSATNSKAMVVYRDCFSLFLMCKEKFMALKSFYRSRLLGMEVDQFLFWIIAPIWFQVLDQHYINESLELLAELQNMAATFLSANPDIDEIVLSIYIELLLSYRQLCMKFQNKPKTLKTIQDQCLEVHLHVNNIFFQMGHLQNVCDGCKNLDKENPDNFDILELWARALYGLNKTEVAIKKAEIALSLSEVESRKKSKLRDLLKEMNEKLDEELSTTDQESVVDSDNEWLETTPIKLPREMKEKAAKIQSEHVKKPRNRPRRQNVERATDRYLNETSCKSETYNTTGISSWKDVTDFDFNFWLKGRGRKRKRRNTGASDLSSATNNTSEAETMLRQLEHDFMESESDDSDVEFENKQSYDTLSLDTLSIADSCDSEDDFDRTMFDRSIPTTGSKDESQESALLQSGIQLSEQCVGSFKIREKKPFYSEFHQKDTLLKLCHQQPDMYKRCTISIGSSHEAVCTNLNLNDSIKKIHISGRSKCGKVFSDDEVVVEILSKTEHSHKENVIPRLNINLNKTKTSDTKIYGKVIGQLERNRYKDIRNPVLICSFDEFENNLVKPLCKTVPKIHVLNKYCENKFEFEIYTYDPNRRNLNFQEVRKIDIAKRRSYVFLVAIINWESIYPRGAIIDVFTESSSITAGLKMLELKHNVPTTYCASTVHQVQTVMKQMPRESNEKLTTSHSDLVSVVAFTIDPPNSQDLDDALSIEKLENGNYRVGVHIADVSSIVKKGDAVDIEAQSRATTFYHGQGMKPYHMLPEPLSQNMCSLLPNERRMTISIFFVINDDGRLTEKPDIKRTITISKRKFTYAEVQGIIEEQNDDILSWELRTLFHLATKMRKQRLGNKFHYFPVETDLSDPSDSLSNTLEAHYLVEEFMVMANHQIATYLCRVFPGCIPLRCQSPPSENMLASWRESNSEIMDLILFLQGIPVSSDKRISIDNENVQKVRYNKLVNLQKWVWQKMVNALNNNNFKEVCKLIGTDNLHPAQSLAIEEWISFQESAEYRCIADSRNPGRDAMHFSLGIKPYTHFTSPIRRYTDIIIHRLLHAALDRQTSPYTKEEVISLCRSMTAATRRAKQFQKQCQSLFWGSKLHKGPIVVHALVQDVSQEKVTLHFPGMRTLPMCCKELPLHLLNVAGRPIIQEDTATRKNILTLKWQKRLYSAKGFVPPNRNKGRECVRVDPHQRSEFQQQLKWIKILKTKLNGNPKKLKSIFFSTDHPNVNMDHCVPACFNTELDVSSEVRGRKVRNSYCDFTMSFNYGQVLAVQLGAEPQNGIMSPAITLFDMTNNVKHCLQHHREPVKMLEQFSKEKCKDRYKLAVDYIKTLLPLMAMEAATNAVKGNSITLNDIPVKFEARGGQFTLREAFCDQRDININSMSMSFILTGEEKQDEMEYVDSSDYLCIRYECVNRTGEEIKKSCEQAPQDRKFWVGHAKVDQLFKAEEKGKLNIHFELHRDSPPPFAEMFGPKKETRCCIEILPKSAVDKRTETILKCLDKSSDLAKSIAVSKKVPRLDKNHMDLAKRIEHDINIRGFPKNNIKQDKAIANALRSSFSLIQGPPGTGKTYTGIKLVCLFSKINRILREEGDEMKQVVFCGPSNKSVDLVAKWLLKKLGDSAPKAVRMYGSSMEDKDYKIPGLTHLSKRNERDSRPDPELKSISLHHIIRKEGKPSSEKLKNFDNIFQTDPESVDYRMIKQYRKDVNTASQEELNNYEVIFCTTSVATKTTFLKGTRGKIYQLIIDEAGMCTEPECLAPIIATRAKQVVLIGDHKQLRPVVLCKEAADLGLEKSLFERYSCRSVFLESQYRMNPSICDFPSETFYKGMLNTKPSSAWEVIEPLKLWTDPKYPHIFCHVEGEEECLTVATEEGNQQSRSNKAEVDQVIKVLTHLIKTEGVDPRFINVISQYNAQCYEIREAIKKEKKIGCYVNTVVSSQGGEWDYVIFSTVRSLPDFRIEPNPTLGWCKQNLGFITDKHQINVALTRARKGLIIIGNSNLLQCDNIWEKLIQHYKRRYCFVEAENFPSYTPKLRKKKRALRLSTQTSEEFYAGTDREMSEK